MAGAVAVLGAAVVLPIVITATIGTGRFNRALGVIEIDPKVLTWPPQCQRFLGAHEAAHSQQCPPARRGTLTAFLLIILAYVTINVAGAIRLGLGGALLELVIETTLCTGLLFLALLEGFLIQCRRLEYAADRAAVAAVGTAGIGQWRHLSENELSRPTRAMLALNAVTGLRTHPSWRRRIAAAHRNS